jgi:tRNA threonylcarbamoyl adenosine modification protein (Sua5/YciO/YrdC/YwlC family)
MLLRVNPERINPDDIDRIVRCLKEGGIIVYPTDSVYALGCDMMNAKAVERICKLKSIKAEKSNFSFICSDLSHLSDFTTPLPNTIFRVMKKALPGPYTFILEANSKVPKLLKQNKKTVGIRVPDNTICREIVMQLGNPITTTSLHNNEDELLDYFTDAEMIYERYKDVVDLVIDGGFGNIYPTTVIDCSGDELTVLREGIGELSILE